MRGGDARGVPRDHERGHHRQIDEPSFAENWDQFASEPSLADYQKFTMVRVEALTTRCADPAQFVRSTAAGGRGTARTRPTSGWPTSSTCSCRSRPARTPSRRRTPVTSTSGGSGGRPAAGRRGPRPRRRRPCDERARASRARGRPHRALRRRGRSGSRHRRDRLRPRRAGAPADRLGEAGCPRPGRGARRHAGSASPEQTSHDAHDPDEPRRQPAAAGRPHRAQPPPHRGEGFDEEATPRRCTTPRSTSSAGSARSASTCPTTASTATRWARRSTTAPGGATLQRLGGVDHSERDGGTTPSADPESTIKLGSFLERRDWNLFPDAYSDPEVGILTGVPRREVGGGEVHLPGLRGTADLHGPDEVQRDIANLKAGMEAAGIEQASCARSVTERSRIGNSHYETDEEFVWACAEAMREEYLAITTRASSSRSTSPPSRRTGTSSTPSRRSRTTAGSRWSASRRSTTRCAESRRAHRFHCCWGSWHGPHVTDIAMNDIVDLLVQINAGSLLRGGQRPPRARVARLAGRGAAGRRGPRARRGGPRDERHRAPAARRRPHRALRDAVGRERVIAGPTAASAAACTRRSPGRSSRPWREGAG